MERDVRISMDQNFIEFDSSEPDQSWEHECDCGRSHSWLADGSVSETTTQARSYYCGDGEEYIYEELICHCGVVVEPRTIKRRERIPGMMVVEGSMAATHDERSLLYGDPFDIGEYEPKLKGMVRATEFNQDTSNWTEDITDSRYRLSFVALGKIEVNDV